jgi:hypothetical protein
MNKFFLTGFLCMVVSFVFSHLRVDTNGSYDTTTNLKQIPVKASQSNITINGSELIAGMYMYSLIVNGQVVDTKRMILTK